MADKDQDKAVEKGATKKAASGKKAAPRKKAVPKKVAPKKKAVTKKKVVAKKAAPKAAPTTATKAPPPKSRSEASAAMVGAAGAATGAAAAKTPSVAASPSPATEPPPVPAAESTPAPEPSPVVTPPPAARTPPPVAAAAEPASGGAGSVLALWGPLVIVAVLIVALSEKKPQQPVATPVESVQHTAGTPAGGPGEEGNAPAEPQLPGPRDEADTTEEAGGEGGTETPGTETPISGKDAAVAIPPADEGEVAASHGQSLDTEVTGSASTTPEAAAPPAPTPTSEQEVLNRTVASGTGTDLMETKESGVEPGGFQALPEPLVPPPPPSVPGDNSAAADISAAKGEAQGHRPTSMPSYPAAPVPAAPPAPVATVPYTPPARPFVEGEMPQEPSSRGTGGFSDSQFASPAPQQGMRESMPDVGGSPETPEYPSGYGHSGYGHSGYGDTRGYGEYGPVSAVPSGTDYGSESTAAPGTAGAGGYGYPYREETSPGQGITAWPNRADYGREYKRFRPVTPPSPPRYEVLAPVVNTYPPPPPYAWPPVVAPYGYGTH